MRLPVRLLSLSVAVVTVSTLPVFLLGAAFYRIGPELGLRPLELGALTGGFFLTAAVSSPVLGRWVQRAGWRRAMRVNVVVSAALTAIIAATAHDLWSLAVPLLAAAAMYGCSNPAANQALARHTDPTRTATTFGLKHAGIPTATLLAGLAVPTVVVRFGWRPAFVLAALVAAAVWALIPPGVDPPVGEGRGSTAIPLSVGELRRLAAVSALGAVAAVALATFLVSAAVDGGFSPVAAGWLQFCGAGTSVIARIIAGVVVDRLGGVFVGLVALLGSGALVFSLLPLSSGAFFVAGVLAAYATGWGWPGLMTASVVGADREVAAATSAVTQAGVFAGAGGGPLLLGWVVDHHSFSPMWLVVSACLLLGAVLAWTVMAPRRVAA